MLVLTRGTNESIEFTIDVGEDKPITFHLKILRINGSQVKVGIEAPQNVRILRKEIADDT